MNNDRKNNIQIWSAVGMLAGGTLMAFISLFLPPVGEISNGALWYTGQCFLYAGGIFGIGTWAQSKVNEIRKDLEDERR